MRYLLLVLAACAPPIVAPATSAMTHSPYEKPPEQTYTYSIQPRKPTVAPPPAPTPVDCQDQTVLAAYGARKEAPLCIEGTEVEQTEHDGCYWSLARGMDGEVRAPTHECHGARNPCFARVVKQVRVDGVVVEHRESCR